MCNIFDMMSINIPLATVIEGIDAMPSVSWSTLTIGQGHATGSHLKKTHPKYTPATIKATAMGMQFRALLAETSDDRSLRASRSGRLHSETEVAIIRTRIQEIRKLVLDL